MTAYDRLPDAVTEVFGPDATAESAYDLLTVNVPAGSWIAALETARDELGCTYFDWLSAVDEPGTGFRVCAHVVSVGAEAGGGAGGAVRVRRLLLRTTVPHDAPVLPTAVHVYAGAEWHERETHEMFGVTFTGHPHPAPLLLPEGFEGHPLRKDFVLAARVAKAWPGAKEPGESAAGAHGPKRRQMLPPGVPDPNEWGPLKGQLPPAPARPARAARAAGAGAAERPVRRTRTAGEGSASQSAPAPTESTAAPEPTAPVESAGTGGTPGGTGEAPKAPRRTRSAADGSASQTSGAAGPRRNRSAADGSASQPAGGAGPRRSRSAGEGSASQRAAAPRTPESAPESGPAPESGASESRTRSSDAPWHHARPAFDDTEAGPKGPDQADDATSSDTGNDDEAASAADKAKNEGQGQGSDSTGKAPDSGTDDTAGGEPT
ncbi:NADH-quinone oxidoreductase subunit C [Streptomyces sp. NPDC003860]